MRDRGTPLGTDVCALVLPTLMDVVEEAVVVTDDRGLPLHLNDAAREAFARAGLPERLSADREYHGLHFFHADRVTPISLAPPLLQHVAQAGSMIPYMTWVGRGDDQRALSITARPLHDTCGTRRGAVIVARDMTTMLEATRVRDDFLRDAAHRLRGHLTSAAGYAELLGADAHAGEAGRRLARVTDQLIAEVDDLFRIARAGIARSIPPTDLSSALADVCSIYIAAANSRGVTVQVIDEGCGEVRFDRAELRQVLADLLSQAIARCRTAGRVVVRAYRDDQRTTVSVSDDGPHTTDDERRRALAQLSGSDPGARTGGTHRRDPVRANQATLSVRPDHPVGTVASLVMLGR